MTDGRRLWRVAGIVGALALLGCGEETGLGDVDGDDEPLAPYALALVSTTADITGPVHYVIRQGDTVLGGVVDGESVAGCEGQHVVGLWEAEAEVHAWTDSGLEWRLDVSLEEDECIERNVDLATTRSILLVFAVGEEDTFLPTIVRLGGEFVGTLTQLMEEDESREWFDFARTSFGEGVEAGLPKVREWFVEPIRAGRAVWTTRPPGDYRLVLQYGNGGVFVRPDPIDVVDGQTRLYWKGKGIFE